MRFFETTQGRITIDGRDIRVMKVETLREMIGLVPQEPVLFEGTVAFNLSVGLESVLTGTSDDKADDVECT